MEIKVSLNESEIMQMVLKGATEKEVADNLKSRIIESAVYKLTPVLFKQIADMFKKEMKKENFKNIISTELKKKINDEIIKYLKDNFVEDIVSEQIYEMLQVSLENKSIKITL